MQLMPKRYLKETHRDYLRMLPVRSQQVGLALLVLALLWIPLRANGYVLGLVTQTAIAIVGAIGLNFLIGFTGQVSIGQAAFMAIGAYTTAIVGGKLGLPLPVALLIAALVTGAASALVAIPTLRLKGFYLAMATFVIHFIVILGLGRWNYVGGQLGIAVPRPSFAQSDVAYAYVVFAVVALLVYVGFNLERSFLGRAWGAIRDRDLAAAAAGISVSRLKLWANAWSGFFVGMCGGLFASYLSYISPEHFTFLLTIQYMGMILVGGLGTTLGSLLGAIFMSLLPEAVRLVAGAVGQHTRLPATFMGDAQMTLFGLIIIVTLLYAPKGLFGLWEDTKLYFRTWPFSY